MSNFNIYKAEGQADLPILSRNSKLNDPKLYQPSKPLMSAVNVALNLGLPLLLTGEPGTGKTQLAHHVAHYFKIGEPMVFNAQTTSQAKDLFYRYDALGHFQYAQTQKEPLTNDEVEKRFITYEALGKAIKEKVRKVVLIDEIDKAPRDLPNDVLAAIDDLEFSVPEIGKTFKADANSRPIIIMTSNSEKNLPDAFLRRVTYHHIPFPDSKTLLKIVSSKVAGYGSDDIDHIIRFFEKLRSGKPALRKKPATAELIQWADMLHRADFPVAKLSRLENLSDTEEELLKMSYSVLAKNKEDLALLEQL